MTGLAMIRTAKFSGENDCYRDELRRIWDPMRPLLVVCMLNPSTADAYKDDPTIIALVHFCKFWGYGGFIVINLSPYRTSSPAVLAKVDPLVAAGSVESEKVAHAVMRFAAANGGKMLAAWGNHGAERSRWFCQKARAMGITLYCLGTTASEQPKHPLARGKHRIPRDQWPFVWRDAA